jgi:hypothetical protein
MTDRLPDPGDDLPVFGPGGLLAGGAVYISTDPERDAREYPARHRIMTVPIPGVVDPAMRDRPDKEIAVAVRALLKQLGIKGCSVTTPRYSMAMGIEIRLPEYPSDWDKTLHPHDTLGMVDCWRCMLGRAARDRFKTLLVAAFPDCEDRSDSFNEHYDWVFHIV